MTQNDPSIRSGDGTRPTTDGGTDNIGAGEKLSTRRNAVGEDVSAPAPIERMGENRSDAEATRHDDSAPFELHQDPTPKPNTEPRDPKDMTPLNSPKG